MFSIDRLSLKTAVPLALAASLAACGPDPVQSSPSPADLQKTATAQQIRVLHGVAFTPGTGAMAAGEQAKLATFARRQIESGDEVVLLADSRGGGLQDARLAAVRGALAAQGIAVVGTSRSAEIATGPDNVLVAASRWVARRQACPDWSKSTNYDPNNTTFSNFGCADAQNLGNMVANPKDLEMGRDPGPADGGRSAAAVERYRRDAVKQIVVVSTGGPAPQSAVSPSSAGAAVGTTGN